MSGAILRRRDRTTRSLRVGHYSAAVNSINGRLKDEFGGRHVRVRGHEKVLAHLMFGMTVLAASQLMHLIVPPI